MKIKKREEGIDDEDLGFDDEDLNFDEDFNDEPKDKYKDDLFNNNLGGFDDFGGGSPSPIEKHADLLKDLTNFDPFLKKLVSEWMGMVWSEDEKKFIKDKNLDPIMNIKGARWCINQLRVYARNNNIITHLDKDTFIRIMEDIVETVLLNIGTRAEYFGIKNDGDILLVTNQLIHSADLILVGAGGNKNYTDFLGTTINRSENVQLTDNNAISQQEKRSFLDKARAIFGR